MKNDSEHAHNKYLNRYIDREFDDLQIFLIDAKQELTTGSYRTLVSEIEMIDRIRAAGGEVKYRAAIDRMKEVRDEMLSGGAE